MITRPIKAPWPLNYYYVRIFQGVVWLKETQKATGGSRAGKRFELYSEIVYDQ